MVLGKVKMLHIFTFCTVEKPKQTVSQFPSVCPYVQEIVTNSLITIHKLTDVLGFLISDLISYDFRSQNS